MPSSGDRRPNESDRRLRHNFRLSRLLRFLELISGRGRWNPKSLMAELEVSERTLHRLRETLELAGVPVFFSKEENAYRVRGDYYFPPLRLTEGEAIAQAVATSLSESDAFKLVPGSGSVTRKIGEGSGDQVGRVLDEVTRLTRVLDQKLADHPGQADAIRVVQHALLSRVMLRGVYHSPHDPGPVDVLLHPLRLVLAKQAWYLVARPDSEPHPRTYRVVRFRSLNVSRHAADDPTEFNLNGYFGNAWSVYRGDRSYAVELLFTPDAADLVLEHRWHHTQQARHHPDGGVTLSFTVDGLNEILRWVVGWGGRVRVMKPPELRSLVVDTHAAAIAMNGGGK